MPEVESQEQGHQEVITPEVPDVSTGNENQDVPIATDDGVVQNTESTVETELPTVESLQTKLAELEHKVKSYEGREKKRSFNDAPPVQGHSQVQPQAFQQVQQQTYQVPQGVGYQQEASGLPPEEQQLLDRAIERHLAPFKQTVQQFEDVRSAAQVTAQNKNDFGKIYAGKVSLDDVVEEMKASGIYHDQLIEEVRLGFHPAHELGELALMVLEKKFSQKTASPAKIAGLINNAQKKSTPVLVKSGGATPQGSIVSLIEEMSPEEQMDYYRSHPGTAKKYREAIAARKG